MAAAPHEERVAPARRNAALSPVVERLAVRDVKRARRLVVRVVLLQDEVDDLFVGAHAHRIAHTDSRV